MSSSFKIYPELVHFSPLITQSMSASHCHVLLGLLQQSFNCSFCFCSFPQNNSVKMWDRHVTPLHNVRAYEVKSFQCYSIGHLWPHLFATSFWLTLLQTQWYSCCSSNTWDILLFSFFTCTSFSPESTSNTQMAYSLFQFLLNCLLLMRPSQQWHLKLFLHLHSCHSQFLISSLFSS